MVLRHKKDDIMEKAVCFADRALLLAESVSEEEGFIGGLLSEASVSLLMSVAEAQSRDDHIKDIVERAKGAFGRCNAALGLLRARGAIGEVAYASLKADGEALIARIPAILGVPKSGD
jgi:hypothetical protein